MMDNVNHPNHYNQGGIEVLDILKAYMTKENYIGFCKGNIIKYILRADYKGGNQDLLKADFYLDELIRFIVQGEKGEYGGGGA